VTRQELIEKQARATHANDIEIALLRWREGEREAAFAVIRECKERVERIHSNSKSSSPP
jgi:hypothetical protein